NARTGELVPNPTKGLRPARDCYLNSRHLILQTLQNQDLSPAGEGINDSTPDYFADWEQLKDGLPDGSLRCIFQVAPNGKLLAASDCYRGNLCVFEMCTGKRVWLQHYADKKHLSSGG